MSAYRRATLAAVDAGSTYSTSSCSLCTFASFSETSIVRSFLAYHVMRNIRNRTGLPDADKQS